MVKISASANKPTIHRVYLWQYSQNKVHKILIVKFHQKLTLHSTYLLSSNSADWFTFEYCVDKFGNKRPTAINKNHTKLIFQPRLWHDTNRPQWVTRV